MILNSPYISGSLTVTNLSGSGVRYLMTSASGLLISQTADAAIKTTYTASSTAGQTVFPVTNGYSTGLVDVFLNGTKLASSDYNDSDGVNITLVTGSDAGDLLEFVKYSPALGVTNNALRQLTTFTSTEGQTVYSASYTPGLLDVYYNGSRLSSAEYTANNGTFITLATGSVAGDVVDMMVYSYQVGSFSGVGGDGVANQVAYWSTTSGITGSSVLTITSGSNVGIGTTSASYNLHTQTAGGTYNAVETLVTSSGAEATFLHKTPNGIALISLGANVSRGLSTALTNDWVFNNRTGGKILWSTDTTGTNAYMSMTNSGSIGINTSSPSSSFHINTTDAAIIPVGTTAQRPATPLSGMFRMNSDTKLPEWYDSYLSRWRSFGSDAIAVEYLVVAGGGGGGIDIGGGGGAGGYQTGTTAASIGTSYTVTVGAGGAANTNGSNSTFYSFVSLGGGKGGTYATNTAGTGGSGGGGGGQSQPAAAGTPGQGKDGGAGTYGGGAAAGGGGGGAGTNGSAATYTSAGVGGNGGNGLQSSITGSSAYYAGGGGGGQRNFASSAPGGLGGGGNGANINNQDGGNAVANTGGGGGGVGSGTTAGTGGSGIIVIKIPSTNIATFSAGLTVSTITSVSGFNIYKVTAGTGTVTFS